jgi:hypothetical protein
MGSEGGTADGGTPKPDTGTSAGDAEAGPATVDAESGAGDGEAGTACSAWTQWNDGLSGGSLEQVQYDPRVAGLAFALAGSRLYGSTDAGAHWTLYSDDTGGIRQVAFPPGNDKVLLAAAADGLRRSDDGGKTWTVAALSGLALSTILVDPAQPQRIFVGGDKGLLMRSNDTGKTWGPIGAGAPFGQTMALIGDPADPNNVVAGLVLEDASGAWGSNGAVIRTTNGGGSWQTVFGGIGLVSGLSQCAANPDVIYASTTNGVGKSTNRGVSWSIVGLAGSGLTDIGIDPKDCNHLYGAFYPAGFATSMDGGANWTTPTTNGLTLQEGYQFAVHIAVDPANGSHVLAATHGGLFGSTNGAAQWGEVAGIASVSIRDLSVSPKAPQELWLASFGSGVWHRPSSTMPWKRVPVDQLQRDWAFTVYSDPVVAGRIMVGAFLGGGDAWRSADNGVTFTGPTVANVNPIVFATDSADGNVVYLGTQLGGVYKSTNGGQSFVPSNAGMATVFVVSLLVDPNDSHTIYAGTQDKGIYVSTDSGASWNPVMSGPTAGAVSSLAKASGGAAGFYAWVDGGGVYRSTDGRTWTASNQGLASLSAGGLVVDATASRVIVVTGDSVFTTTDGTTYKPFEPDCAPPFAGGKPVIVGSGAARWVAFGAGTSGILAHPL